jgi:hypothetical protein
MAITTHSMELIAAARGSGPAASLGYPDLLLWKKEIAHYVGGAAKTLPAREDSAKIAQWHGVALDEVYESKAYFKALGYDLDVFDIKPIRGDEIFIDLNEPLWPQYRERYSLVLDPGTCEHCFHIGQAAMNVAEMCAQGGHIVQGLPLNAYNHGFYCVSPTWVRDFYEDNGFEIEACFGVSGGKRFPVDHRKRIRGIPENAFMLSLVKRVEVRKLKVPTQWKYR